MQATRILSGLAFVTLAITFGIAAPGCGGEEAAAEVTLETPGDGPMRELRLHPTTGTVQQSTMTIEMTIDQQLSDGSSQSPSIPKMSITTETIVDSVHEDGRIDCSFNVVDARALRTPGVDAFARSQVQTALEDMIGTTGTLALNSRGIILESHVNMPPGADAMTRQMLNGLEEEMMFMSIHLPEEAVGAGAVWVVTETATLSGIRQTITTTYTVKSIEGELVTLSIDMHSTADSQEIDSPEMPPGATVELDSHEAFGWGTLVMDLRWLDPIEASLKIDGEQELTVRMGGQRMSIEQQPSARMRCKTVQTTPERVAAVPITP